MKTQADRLRNRIARLEADQANSRIKVHGLTEELRAAREKLEALTA